MSKEVLGHRAMFLHRRSECKGNFHCGLHGKHDSLNAWKARLYQSEKRLHHLDSDCRASSLLCRMEMDLDEAAPQNYI
ncbi:hypothetical protein OPV22_007685 [Ensete ventricosum]|uniref:Uncharacterized protein n=1 Tax=Ensete ventricosum TaxID=4639 RepID=A0AAV8RQQ8_ENSVE|nr:hypothetical protein OPV22_007685 [Ensete ventricosum]